MPPARARQEIVNLAGGETGWPRTQTVPAMRSCSVRRRSSKMHQTSASRPGQAEHDQRDRRAGLVRAPGDQGDDADRHQHRRRLQDLRDALARRYPPAADRTAVVLDDVRAQQPLAPGVAAPCQDSELVGDDGERCHGREIEALATGQQPDHDRERPGDDQEVDHDGGGAPPEARVAAVAADRAVGVQHPLRAADAAALPARRGRVRADRARRGRQHIPIVPRPSAQRGRASRYAT